MFLISYKNSFLKQMSVELETIFQKHFQEQYQLGLKKQHDPNIKHKLNIFNEYYKAIDEAILIQLKTEKRYFFFGKGMNFGYALNDYNFLKAHPNYEYSFNKFELMTLDLMVMAENILYYFPTKDKALEKLEFNEEEFLNKDFQEWFIKLFTSIQYHFATIHTLMKKALEIKEFNYVNLSPNAIEKRENFKQKILNYYKEDERYLSFDCEILDLVFNDNFLGMQDGRYLVFKDNFGINLYFIDPNIKDMVFTKEWIEAMLKNNFKNKTTFCCQIPHFENDIILFERDVLPFDYKEHFLNI